MLKLAKDPLVHFLVLGALLFGISAWRGDAPEIGSERIVVSAAQVQQVRQAATLLAGASPSREELEELIEPIVREEVLYREALALGLDENDDEVRRRLVEKMQYLTTDLADPEPASDEELRAFYDESPERFREPETVTFEQVFFSPSARGDSVESDAEAALEALRRGEAAPAGVGDRTPLRDRYDAAPREQVTVLFGEEFTAALFDAPVDEWLGPFTSDFGLHVARVRGRTASRIPPFGEIRDRVAETFAAVRREAANAAAYERMRERYDVVIEWPEEPGGAEAE